jgi:hypothetical protein
MPSTSVRSTDHAREAPVSTTAARTFARRIDCAEQGGRAALPGPARGAGRPDPETWERASRQRG